MHTRSRLIILAAGLALGAVACLPYVPPPTSEPPTTTTTTTTAPVATGSKDKNYTGAAGTPRVLIAGDSITYYGRDAFHTALDPSYQTRAFGWAGYTVVKYDASFGATLAAQAPNVVVINLGTNDIASPSTESTTVAAFATLYGRFTNACTVGVTINEHVSPASGRDVAEATRLNGTIRGLADHVVEWSNAVAGRPDLFSTDRYLVHPDANGQALLASMIRDAINQC